MGDLTPEEQNILADMWDGKQVDTSSIPEDRKEILAQAWDAAVAQTNPLENLKQPATKILGAAGQVLDYPAGLTRTALMDVAPTPQDAVSAEDWKLALQGKAPSATQYLEKGGVGELGSITTNAGTKYTGRGLLGGTIDVAADPALLLTGGAGISSKLGAGEKVVKGLTTASQFTDPVQSGLGLLTKPVGRGMFRAGVSELDEVARAAGKGRYAVSDVMQKYGIKGSAKNIQNLSQQQVGLLENQIQDIINQVPGRIDVDKAFAPAKAELNKILEKPGLYTSDQIAAAQKQLDEVNRLIAINRYVPETTVNPRAGQQTSLLAPAETTPVFTQKTRNVLEINAPLSAKQQAITPSVDLGTGGAMVADWQKPLPPSTGETLPLFNERMADVGSQPLLSADPYAQLNQSTKVNPNVGLSQYTEVTPSSRPMAEQTSLLTGADLESVPNQVIPGTEGMSVSDAKKLNTNIYKAINKSSWGELMPDNVKSAVQKAMASGNKAEYMRVVNEFSPELGTKLEGLLQDQAALLTARKQMGKEATKEANRKGFTQVDAMALFLEPGVYGAKQVAKFGTGTNFLTRTGALLAADNNPLLRGAVRAANPKELKNYDSSPAPLLKGNK